jgi:hypothetical protein
MAKILRSKKPVKTTGDETATTTQETTKAKNSDWSYEATGIAFERNLGQRTLVVEVAAGTITYKEEDFPRLVKKASIKKAIQNLNNGQELSNTAQRKLRKYVANVLNNAKANPAVTTIGELAPNIKDAKVTDEDMDGAANNAGKKSTKTTNSKDKFNYKNGAIVTGQYLLAEKVFRMELDNSKIPLYEAHDDLTEDLMKCEVEIVQMSNGANYAKFVKAFVENNYDPSGDVRQFVGAYGNREMFDEKGATNNDGIIEAYTMADLKVLLADVSDSTEAYTVLAETFGATPDSIIKISVEINGESVECLASIQSLIDTEE